MKKTSWLSLATAAAIVATSAGTFAAWDQMTATTDKMALTIQAPVKQVFTTTESFDVKNKSLSATVAPTYEKNIELEISNLPTGIDLTDYKVTTSAQVLAKDTETVAQHITATVEGTPTVKIGKQILTVKVTPDVNNPITTNTDYDVVVTAEIVPPAQP